MNLDPSIAYTALLELWPEHMDRPETSELADAMTAADPPDRWAFARRWIAGRLVSDTDRRGAPYVLPWPADMNYDIALAIAGSRHPSRVLAITNVYRYGRFTRSRWCAVCASAESGHGSPGHRFTPSVEVRLFGNKIAEFQANGVQLSAAGHATASTTEALSALVTGGYFYTDKGAVMFSDYATTGSRRAGTPLRDFQFFPYRQKARA